MKREILDNIAMIDAMTGSRSTPEQVEFEYDFTSPLYSFSNPGTGKSHSIIKGIINAQTYYRIPGGNINAMSYTREATGELKARYDKACKKCHISPTATFNTFHSICLSILKDKYPNAHAKSGYNMTEDLNVLQQYMEREGFTCDDMYYIKKVLLAIDNLNHTLIYDEDNVALSYRFKELDMDIKLFQALRRDIFQYNLVCNSIPQGDIPNYALYVLLTNDDIRQKYLQKYKIMIVDEFQDMTKLYLVILSMISENLIVIGDMKQQIYGFNGACSDIVNEYRRIYPNARRIDLTQSFRCKDEIAAYATGVYYPNDTSVEAFTGVGDGGTIKIMKSAELPLAEIVSNIKKDMFTYSNGEEKNDTMFLFRNNFSLTPIAEELYKQGVPFRVKKFFKIMDLPIYKELTDLAWIASEPDNMEYIKAIVKLFPEMRKYKIDNCPVIKAMQIINGKYAKSGVAQKASLLTLGYDWSEESSVKIINSLRIAADKLAQDCTCKEVFDILMPIYEKYIIEGKWWKLDQKPEYYAEIVAPIIENKTFPQMITEEYDKESKIAEAENVGMGVKCYTMHSAKGLEAGDVYIIDAESVLFPSAKNMKKLIEADCDYEASKVVREERNLLYVAITRAKNNVVITYRDDLTHLITSPLKNEFSYLDDIFKSTTRNFNDVQAFVALLNVQQPKEKAKNEESYINESSNNAVLDIDDI